MSGQNLKDQLSSYYGEKNVSPYIARRLQSLAQVDERVDLQTQANPQSVHHSASIRWPGVALGMAACIAVIFSGTSLYLVQSRITKVESLDYLIPNFASNKPVQSNMHNTNHASPNLVAVKYQINGCPKSAECEPAFVELVDKFGQQQVIFCRYDMTNKTTMAQSQNLASILGVDWAFEGARQSGTILLIDRESRKVIGKLTNPQQLNQLEEVLTKALPDT